MPIVNRVLYLGRIVLFLSRIVLSLSRIVLSLSRIVLYLSRIVLYLSRIVLSLLRNRDNVRVDYMWIANFYQSVHSEYRSLGKI